jgi:hypothetical protein
MEIERLRSLLAEALSKMEGDLKRYASLFCAEHGYYMEDITLFFDNSALAPGIRVSLTFSLSYGSQLLGVLAAALEDDLNNIVFDYAYSRRHKIGAEDLNPIKPVPYLGEHVAPCFIASQN